MRHQSDAKLRCCGLKRRLHLHLGFAFDEARAHAGSKQPRVGGEAREQSKISEAREQSKISVAAAAPSLRSRGIRRVARSLRRIDDARAACGAERRRSSQQNTRVTGAHRCENAKISSAFNFQTATFISISIAMFLASNSTAKCLINFRFSISNRLSAVASNWLSLNTFHVCLNGRKLARRVFRL